MIAILAALFFANIQERPAKELAYTFKEGNKFTWKVRQIFDAKFDKIPEEYKDFLGEKPLDLTIDLEVEFIVKSFKAEGTAVLEGVFKRFTAQGNIGPNAVDYSLDAKKKNDAPDEEEEDPNFGFNPAKMFEEMTSKPATLLIEKTGEIKVSGGSRRPLLRHLLNINWPMGPFPEKTLGPGDSWTTRDSFALPQIPIPIRFASVNTYARDEKVRGAPCTVIDSTLTVEEKEVKAEEPEEMPIPLDLKTAGKGRATTFFSPEGDFLLTSSGTLKVRVNGAVTNPSDGEDAKIKAKIRIKTERSLSRRP